MACYDIYASPVGPLFLVCEGDALTGLYMDREPPAGSFRGSARVLCQAQHWLDGYFSGCPEKINFPVIPEGTAFQKLVWERLRQIPWGQTVTYGQLASEIATVLGKEKMSAQAVGQAVGRNPVSILIPCHRVVGTGGKLTGYAGGLEKKKWLLRHEEARK